jgi:hypothetical protein
MECHVIITNQIKMERWLDIILLIGIHCYAYYVFSPENLVKDLAFSVRWGTIINLILFIPTLCLPSRTKTIWYWIGQWIGTIDNLFCFVTIMMSQTNENEPKSG